MAWSRASGPIRVAFGAVLLVVFLLAACTTGLLSGPIPSQAGRVALLLCQEDDCPGTLLAFIDASQEVKCAFYDLDYEPLETLLAEKAERGEAEMLLFAKNHDPARHGFASPVPARHGGLMHHKFCILNRRIVITGSTNPTRNCLTKNDNHLIIIEGERVAQNYLDEFDELKGEKERRVTFPVINHTLPDAEGAPGHSFLIENYFCPEDGCENELLAELRAARSSIRFLTFSFTSDAVGELLIQRQREGLFVEGVFEGRQENDYSEYPKLREAGIDVRLDGNKATMHHKAFLMDVEEADRATLILGSYNPTKNGDERNDENLLIIRDAAIAERFAEEFTRVWEAAE